jgi:hypothetical protein
MYMYFMYIYIYVYIHICYIRRVRSQDTEVRLLQSTQLPHPRTGARRLLINPRKERETQGKGGGGGG